MTGKKEANGPEVEIVAEGQEVGIIAGGQEAGTITEDQEAGTEVEDLEVEIEAEDQEVGIMVIGATKEVEMISEDLQVDPRNLRRSIQKVQKSAMSMLVK